LHYVLITAVSLVLRELLQAISRKLDSRRVLVTTEILVNLIVTIDR